MSVGGYPTREPCSVCGVRAKYPPSPLFHDCHRPREIPGRERHRFHTHVLCHDCAVALGCEACLHIGAQHQLVRCPNWMDETTEALLALRRLGGSSGLG